MKPYQQVKPLPFRELKGISAKTIDNHYGKLYQGYVKKCAELEEKIKTADRTTANATYAEIRELKLEQGFAAAAVVLHEAYFDVLGGAGRPQGEIMARITRDFGSFEAWLDEFKALGLAARGWVVLAYDFNDGRLHNYLADAHNQGGLWGVAPILVLDVYEHAYFIDFGADRKSYLEAFFQNLNWSAVDKRLARAVRK